MEPKTIPRALRPVIWLLFLALPVALVPAHQGRPLLSSQALSAQLACMTCGGH